MRRKKKKEVIRNICKFKLINGNGAVALRKLV